MTPSEQAFEDWFAVHWPKLPSFSRAQLSQWKHKRAMALAGWIAGHLWGWQQERKIHERTLIVQDRHGN